MMHYSGRFVAEDEGKQVSVAEFTISQEKLLAE
jgi:hypothetical protein